MSTKSQRGFTLVEIAVVTPMMILVVLALLALLIALVNSISVPTKQNTLVSSNEKTFEAIAGDVTSSSGFLAAVPSGGFNDPNANNYAPSTLPANTEVLIIQGYNQTATSDSGDTTGTRTQPAFLGTSPCGTSTSLDKTNIVPIVIVYFVKDGTLWRRVLTATSPGLTCKTPLLIKQTCPPPATPPCTDEDTPLVKDVVTEFKLIYYASDTSDTIAADKTTARSVSASMKSEIRTGGELTMQSSTIRSSRANN